MAGKVQHSEIKRKKSWFRSDFELQFRFEANDYVTFEPILKAIEPHLLEWFQQRFKRCGQVTFIGTIHPWIQSRVKESLLSQCFGDTGFAFLRELPIQIRLFGQDQALLFDQHFTYQDKTAVESLEAEE